MRKEYTYLYVSIIYENSKNYKKYNIYLTSDICICVKYAGC